MAANVVLAHEAAEAGQALGLNRDALLEILKNGSAGSFSLNVYSSMSSMKDFDHGARLLKKDVNILRDCANSDSAKEIVKGRSEGRRVGKECVSKCRSRWVQYN